MKNEGCACAFLARSFFSFGAASVLEAGFLCVIAVVRGFAAAGDLDCSVSGDLAIAAVTVRVPESDKAPPLPCSGWEDELEVGVG
jgi:hypothetical protein